MQHADTRYLERALTEMSTPDDIARHIAPLGGEHISLTGDYSWERDDPAGAGSAEAAPHLAVIAGCVIYPRLESTKAGR